MPHSAARAPGHRRGARLRDEARFAPNGESNQAMVRLRASLVYLAILGALDAFGQGTAIASGWGPAVAYAAFAALHAFVVRRDLLRGCNRVFLSLCLDHVIFAYGYFAGEAGFVIVFWAPIFATIGYGLRFGTLYARYSMLAGGALTIPAIIASPFWQAQPYMAAGILLGTLALPAYALYLSRNIEHGRQHAESRAADLERAASTDPLTGLLNRRGFAHLLETRLDSDEASALLYIDLDGFKACNDAGGHDLGDKALQQVAQAIHACLRVSDPVARIGGDEFAVLVSGLLERSDAGRLADKMIAAVNRIRIDGYPELRLGASIGVSFLPRSGCDSALAAMKAADALMYRAKRDGKNRYASDLATC